MKIQLLSLFILLSGCSEKKNISPKKTLPLSIKASLKTPESFCYSIETREFFISNINGNPSAMDNNGYISRLDSNYNVKENNFIEGGKNGVELNGPKGLTVWNNKLYVADIDSVRSFSLPGGLPVASNNMARMGARFLNDITVFNGKLFVTDTTTKKIFTLDPNLKKAELLIQLKDSPNGIIPVPGEKLLCVVTMGAGKILNIDPQKKKRILFFDGFKQNLKNLDGVVFDSKKNLIFSSFSMGKIFLLSPEKKLTTIAKNLTTPADIGIDDKDRILVPLFQANRAQVIEIPTALK